MIDRTTRVGVGRAGWVGRGRSRKECPAFHLDPTSTWIPPLLGSHLSLDPTFPWIPPLLGSHLLQPNRDLLKFLPVERDIEPEQVIYRPPITTLVLSTKGGRQVELVWGVCRGMGGSPRLATSSHGTPRTCGRFVRIDIRPDTITSA